MSVATSTASPSLSGRDIPTLEALYEAAGDVNFTPGWVPARSRSFGMSRGRNMFPLTGAMTTPRPGSMPRGG
jgi:hypothetical protein